jgi:hypothetical protein
MTTTITREEYRELVAKMERRSSRKKGRVDPHTSLVNTIVERINMTRTAAAFKMPVGEMPTPSGGYMKFGFPGMADIMVRRCWPGMSRVWDTIWIECKTGTGVLSKDQEVFAEMARRWGDTFIVARSVEDAERAVGV